MSFGVTYLQKILDTFWVVTVALSADSFNLFDLSCFAGTLNVFEVHIRVLTKVDNGTQEIEQTWNTNWHIFIFESFKIKKILKCLGNNMLQDKKLNISNIFKWEGPVFSCPISDILKRFSQIYAH